MKKNICVCGSCLSETFEAEIMENIIKRANVYGYSVHIYATIEELYDKTANNEGEASIFELIQYENLAGIVIFGERIKDLDVCKSIISKAKEHDIPVVSIDMYFDGCYNIGYDYNVAFEQIVRHVIEHHGCRDVYVMGGFEGNSFSEARIDIVRKVLNEYGITLKDDHIGYGNFWSAPCKEAFRKFLDSGITLPEAIISVNDSMAITILEELRLRGYNVPEDVIVTGFDGVDEEKYCYPRLTTAAQDNVASGRLAVDIIDRISKGGACESENIIPFTVRFSQSCGCQMKKHEIYMSYVRTLLDRIDGDHQFSRFMDQMREKLTLVKDINNIYENLDEFIGYLEEYSNCFICTDKNLLSVDPEFFEKIDNSNPDEDMVLFKCNTEKPMYDTNLISYSKSELLPDYDKHINDVTNMIFMPIHMLDDVFGYCAFFLKDDIGYFYKLSQFVTSLALVFSTVKQSCEMNRAFEELSAVKAEIEKLYIIDPLTGSYNRRGFYQEFAKLINNKTSGYVILLSADVDYLKYINDNFGHNEGDYAIIALSDALRHLVGDNGIVARFGGDEYTVALYVDKYSDLQKINVSDIIDSFTNKKNETGGKPYMLQFSYGYEVIKLPMYRDIDQIIEVSDERMYEMKKRHHAERGVL